MILNVFALAVVVSQLPQQPDLDWLAGYWLSCEDGVEVAEAWTSRRGGIMLGVSVTTGNDAFSWEQMRIEAGPEGLALHSQPRGQPAAEFRLARSANREAVFENPAHDFPRRVVYRRVGDRLTARIEGESDDGAHGLEWHYRSAPLNARCPDRRSAR